MTKRQRPTVFISHDSRDHRIAEGFAAMIEDATANIIDTFRSSDKTGEKGIPIGDNWYRSTLEHLDRATDVVCILTPNSYERPWVVFEAGYALGRHNKRVYGLVVGLDMDRVAANGPFAPLQNCTDDPAALAALITRIARRVEHCTPSQRVLERAVSGFVAGARRAQKAVRRVFGPRHPRKVHHVSLPVRDLARSVAFYSNDIGLRRVPRPKLKFKVPGAWFEFPDGQQLHLIQNLSGTFRSSQAVDYNDCHFAVRVPDLAAAYDRLSPKYVTDVNKDIIFGRYPHFYVLDPDSHVVEINADVVSDRTRFGQYYRE